MDKRLSFLTFADRDVKLSSKWQIIQILEFIPAFGISFFGSALLFIIGQDYIRPLPLLFAAAWLIYLIDRKIPSPEDRVNLPQRVILKNTFVKIQNIAIVIAAAILFIYPLFINLNLYSLIIPGTIIAVCYSAPIPLLKFRIKRVPILKTLLPPIAISLSFFSLIIIQQVSTQQFTLITTAACWAFLLILANILICDLRDLKGDQQAGIKSIPAFIGKKRSRSVIYQLILISLLPALLLQSGEMLLTSIYFMTIIKLKYLFKKDLYYNWWIESFLFILPLLCLLTSALSSLIS